MRILCDHPNTEEKIILENGYVLKISKKGISDKIRNEAVFYENLKNINHPIKKHFPKFYGYEIENQTNKLKLEYLKNYKTLSSYLLENGQFSYIDGCLIGIADKITKFILLLARSKKPDIDQVKLFEQFYFIRPRKRLVELCKDTSFNNLVKFQKIYINGKVFDNVNNYFKILDRHNKLLNQQQYSSFFHGDLHFENILLRKNRGLKLVDPNGIIIGLISYDIGKLLHSIIGKYDFIQNYRYKLNALGQNKFNFSVQTNKNHTIFSEMLANALQNNIDKLLMLQSYFACWSHMISLIPHHIKNGKDQALAFYLQSFSSFKLNVVFFQKPNGNLSRNMPDTENP
ncbi:MAG: aminoglycoside phosphotransferase family protein [Candidatus Gastranaerophilales bacterium]|nr:aminoglycoside phosphotransferase family protein [Candidatus Gastranaerophilales bacterium]